MPRAARVALISIVLLIPCFWQRRIQAVDLPSHIYNSWLAQQIELGKAPGLAIDGTGDILIGSGSGMRATVRDFHYNTLTFLPDFTPFAATFRGGISSLVVSDVDGDGMADLVVGSGQGGQGQYAYFSSKTATWKYVAAYNDSGFNSQVYVAAAMVDSDGVIEVFTGQGQDGRSRKLRRWNLTGASPTSVDVLTPSITFFGGFLLG